MPLMGHLVDSLFTVHLCMIPSRNFHDEPLHIHTPQISQGITPNNHQGQQMRNSHKVRMDNELNIS